MNVTFTSPDADTDKPLLRQGRRGGLCEPEGPPAGGRHARLHLQRHARRRRGQTGAVHGGLCETVRLKKENGFYVYIKTLNNIAPRGLAKLGPAQFKVDNEAGAPQGILVRSAKMHEMELPESLLAIGRAGAGVNNIPVEKCSEAGVVVFNTPGANAGGVAELTIGGLVLASRNLLPAMEWAQGLAGEGRRGARPCGKRQEPVRGPELAGKKLGVVGLAPSA